MLEHLGIVSSYQPKQTNKAILNFTLNVRKKFKEEFLRCGEWKDPRGWPRHPLLPPPPPEAEWDGVKGWKSWSNAPARGQSPVSNRKEEKFSLDSVIGQKKEIRSHSNWKRGSKLSLCVDAIISHRDPPQPHKKLLELVNELKVAGYNTSNSGLSLYTNSELSDIELYQL